MVGRDSLGRLAVALLGAALVSLCQAQPRGPTTENQARYYIYGAFLTHAAPEIMGKPVTLGPELEQRLGLPPGADRLRVYDALMSYTDGKRITVRKAAAEEIASYKRQLKQPVFRVQVGEIALLVEYDMASNTIPFVGQLAVAYEPPRPVAAKAPVAPPPPPPMEVLKEVLKPNGPCLVKPVMSEQDLANCRDAPSATVRAAPVAPPPVAVPPPVKPQARVAPPPPPPAPRIGPCEVKPVMSEEDLANCRAASGTLTPVQPGPPVAVKPQARAEPARVPSRAGPCVIKPVMSEEDLANCRAASGSAKPVQPGPPVVVKPQARVDSAPAPQRAGPCEIKPVMSEEDLANCRNAPVGAARVQPAPPPAVTRAAPSAAPVQRQPTTPCVIKPVMSEEDLAACGIRR